MDKMFIKDLEIYAFHGVNKEEKKLGQRFLLSVELSLDLKEAGQTDDLSKTVNYANLCLELEEVFISKKYELIERVAEQLCDYILHKYENVNKVKLMIKKPWAPIGKILDYAAIELERGWNTAYIGLGSNIGDREENIRLAIEKIGESQNNKIIQVSKMYETEPVGFLEQDKFINNAIEIKTLLSPRELIKFLLNIEIELKRVRTIKWGPRTIDLDILLYNDEITYSKDIVIPHPRMHERKFVLLPLCDIAPYVLHPILYKRIDELLKELDTLSQE